MFVMKDSMSTMFRFCIILCLVRASLQVKISEFAVPSSIKMGESAELQCQYQLDAAEARAGYYVKWWWTPLGAGEDGRLHIYQRIRGQPPWHRHLTNIEVKDNDTLVLKDLLPKHSGTYECAVSANYNDANKTQEMIVYTAGSGPAMNITEVVAGPEGEQGGAVQVECRAEGVAPRPDLVVTLDGQEVPDSETQVTALPEGLFDIATNVTLSKAAALGQAIRCELFYTDTKVTHEAFYVDTTYEELGAVASTPAPATEESTDALNFSTEDAPNAGTAWSAWALLLTAAALLASAPADFFT